MALSVDQLTAMRDALIGYRAKGIRTAQMPNGERVEFKTDAEMAAAIHDLEVRIRRASAPPPAVVRFSTSKGV
uniref:Uncharacterized protein n=1 Tax=Cereibacter sphaeroides (strain ATCC 17025 / ATH 2.4.3) TaxID=349102 RepID=A4WNT5_CERS5